MNSNLSFQKICILIPAFNPDNKLLNIIDALCKIDFFKIIVINDGSDSICSPIFNNIVNQTKVILLSHPYNMGKGAALKTGFKFYLDNYSSVTEGIITVDADGQHSVESIIKISKNFIQNSNDLTLGVRSFQANIPFRSLVGNTLTRKVFLLAHGIDIVDTQTGLRAIPKLLSSHLLDIKSNRYDFEMEALIIAKKLNFIIHQIEIETIYFDKNSSSHFNPLTDSIRIYFVLLKFALSSILCFIIDILFFIIFFKLIENIFIATYLSRIISGYTNFHLNRHSVFKSSSNNWGRELLLYVSLAIGIAFLSSLIVSILFGMTKSYLVLIKIFVDTNLFFLSFVTQKHYIFKN